MLILEIHQKTKRLLVIGDVLYNYCENDKSTTRNKNYDRVIKNISDRVFVSCAAIAIAKKYDDVVKNAAIYNQIKMVKGSLMDLAKTNVRDKSIITNSLMKILTKNSFTVERDKLRRYMRSLGFLEILKNYMIVNAILDANYECIWFYILLYRLHIRGIC